MKCLYVYSVSSVMAYDANLGPGLMELTRNVPAAYDCGQDGCGGGLSTENPDTIIYWNHGICASQDACESVLHLRLYVTQSYCELLYLSLQV